MSVITVIAPYRAFPDTVEDTGPERLRSGGHACAAIRRGDRKGEADTGQGELSAVDRERLVWPHPVIAATDQVNTNGSSPDHQSFPERGYRDVSPDVAPGFRVVGRRQDLDQQYRFVNRLPVHITWRTSNRQIGDHEVTVRLKTGNDARRHDHTARATSIDQMISD